MPQYIPPQDHDSIRNLLPGEFALPELQDWDYAPLNLAMNTVGAMRTNMINAGIQGAGNWVPQAPNGEDLENLQNVINQGIQELINAEPNDDDLIEIFHKIQLWGGNTGRGIYVRNNGFAQNFNRDAYRGIFTTAKNINSRENIAQAINSFQISISQIQNFGLSFGSKHISFFSLAAHAADTQKIHIPIFDSILSKGCFGMNFPDYKKFKLFSRTLNNPEEEPLAEYSVQSIERTLFNFFGSPAGQEWIRLRLEGHAGNAFGGPPPQQMTPAPTRRPSGDAGNASDFSTEQTNPSLINEPNPPAMNGHPIQGPHPECLPIPQWAEIDRVYVFAHHGGPYITLRERSNGNRNNAWINTNRYTIDFHTHPSPGLQKDLWAKIGCCTNHELALPDGVEVVQLNGPTQHNAGAGYSVGLNGFESTEQILRYIRRYVYLFSAPGNPAGTPYSDEYLTNLTPLE